MRCVSVCPDEVVAVGPQVEKAYAEFKKSWYLTEEMMEAKQSRIISAAWQAAF
jgi:hypothetical protein